MNEADRDVWNEMQRDAAPDIRVLSNRKTKARKAFVLDCGCPIAAGQFYCSAAWLEDGQFHAKRDHVSWLDCRLTITVWGTETVQGITP
jgi:hypothetical protein